jgi:hypothetical protein
LWARDTRRQSHISEKRKLNFFKDRAGSRQPA